MKSGIALLISLSSCIASAADECAKAFPDHMSEVQCITQESKRLDEELNTAYQAALAARPEINEWDNRKNKEQLRKSQRAWLKFKEENCTLIGGLEGGSNLWVTQFIAQCENEEIVNRVKFLQRVAAGQFGG